ncbi:dCTP deaminase [Alkalihalophilus marmarensis]|uniref:dCTP deaminase n=1 Tax=Alkalihalophilus marmarensis TaxID=521377 RepID=UPI002E1B968B|nr:dCTP deaminase [Alkalihalophilus marmarensis]MED1601751.1 dCTP deaminase [Alkalihalophilus marmarensis]
MSLVSGDEIKNLISSEELVITPLLDKDNQVGPSGIDLRLSNEFKVSIQTRNPVLSVEDEKIETFFQETYKEFGENVIIYPNQLVLANTFEYIRMPDNVMGFVYTRSSFERLGLSITSVIQPGYAGTLTLQLTNKGENAIKLRTGMRIVQLVLFQVSKELDSYRSAISSKYVGNIHPVLSEINRDQDLDILKKIRNK